jgi:hypothetical protein
MRFPPLLITKKIVYFKSAYMRLTKASFRLGVENKKFKGETMRNKRRVIPRCFFSNRSGLLLFSILLSFYGIPQINASEFSIDETMPQTIPEEIIADWKAQDQSEGSYASAIAKINDELPLPYKCRAASGNDEAAYINACHLRRISRIQRFPDQLKNILYARHHDIGGTIIGFTEELKTDSFISGIGRFGTQPAISRGPYYSPGSALLLLQMKNMYPSPSILKEDPNGVIRDPCVSFDGKKVVFAWSKDNNGYHIYEMEINNPEKPPVQLTDDPPGLTVSDFEPCYLPNGDIVFNSSRCFGYVDCNFNITSNLYIMNKEGNYLRRVCFDQLHTSYPTITSNGTILYSRWEYNDRNIATCYGLFYMHADGTHQTEYFGNQTTWPATISQGREIPNSSGKILGISGGHMGPYAGDLIIIDPSMGRNGSKSVKLIAPKRPNPVDPPYLYGVPDSNKLFQNPYPLSEDWFLISYRPNISSKFKIYLMDINGNRELLAWDEQSVSQQQSVSPPFLPIRTANTVDYTKTTGEVTMTNAYYGSGTGDAVLKGSIKKIRVIALEYHTDPSFGNTGGGASQGITMTPVARWLGSWMSKRILGEAAVDSNGAAKFIVPARTPVYFQLIDSNGCAINSMRSWATLMPGETFSCYGCHEDKNVSPPTGPPALSGKSQELDSFYGIKNEHLYYPKHIQSIWDAKCIKCHKPGKPAGEILDLSGTKIWTGDLKNDPNNVNACRFWCKSYYNLTVPKYVNFIDVNSRAEGLPPYSAGAIKSGLLDTLRNPPPGMKVSLTKEETGKICAWIDLCIPHSGFYTDDMRTRDSSQYLERLKRRDLEDSVEEKNIAQFIAVGGYKSYSTASFDTKNSVSGSPRRSENNFSVYPSSSGKRLIVRIPGKGTMDILDVLGRTVKTFSFDVARYDRSMSVSFGTKLPKGVYIASFKGSALKGHQIITVQ